MCLARLDGGHDRHRHEGIRDDDKEDDVHTLDFRCCRQRKVELCKCRRRRANDLGTSAGGKDERD